MKRFTLLALLFTSCATPKTSNFLTVDKGSFVDGQSREVIFNGINHVHKVPADDYMNGEDSLIFKGYQQSGFNFIRFGVYWNRLEPKPGQISESYLAQLDRRVRWAEQFGLMMMIDLHQDLYLEAAPAWAVLNDGAAHITGQVWSDAYMISPAVQIAFDSFWANRAASDSIGIMDRYLGALSTIARRYKDNPTVVGYDVMNEPFMGTSANQVMPLMMGAYAQATGAKEPLEVIAQRWSSVESRLEILENLNNRDIFHQIILGIQPVVDEFEQGVLSDFYQRVRDSIRNTGSRQILFLEHNYFCNLGVPSTFRVPTDENGVRDSLCAYAPHGYDLVTDTGGDNNPGTSRVDYIFNSIFESARARQLPVLIGEWGAYYGGDFDYMQPAQHIISLIEAARSGQSYWAYWKGVDSENYYKTVLSRTYPMAVNGRLDGYKNDFEQGLFSATWNEGESKGSTIMYVPDPQTFQMVELTPESEYKIRGNYLEIAPLGNVKRSVKLGNIK